MNKWMLFAGYNFYPGAGIADYKGSYDSLGAAMIAYFTEHSDEYTAYDWAHAVRLDEAGRIAEKSDLESWPKNMAERDYGDVYE